MQESATTVHSAASPPPTRPPHSAAPHSPPQLSPLSRPVPFPRPSVWPVVAAGRSSTAQCATPSQGRRCDVMRCDAPRPSLPSDWRRLDWLSPVDSFSSRPIPSVRTADPSTHTFLPSTSLHLSIALHTFMPLRWDRRVTLPPVRPSLRPSFACVRQRAALGLTSLASSLSPRQFVLCPSL